MMTAERPPPPPRTSASLPSRVTFKGAQLWRESVATTIAIILALSVFVSILCLGYYVYEDKAVYEELVDYLDKTISISKINYNHLLGLYQLKDREIEDLGSLRTYKTILWCYLAAELGCYIFLGIAILLYFTTQVSSGTVHVIFWILFALGALYCICEVHIFTFMLFPFSATLPNATEKLLNHAIPHNPGGLLQMEQRLGCTFDHDIYAAYKRRLNPKNTCDPQIESSYIPRPVLVTLLVLRLTPIVIGALLLAKRTPLSESVATLMEKFRPNARKQSIYVKKQQFTNSPYSADKNGTTFGVTQPRGPCTPLPPVPSPSIDHSISYNNAAYFATSGVVGLNSSRSSEISRIDANELFKPPMAHHASGSLQSEV